MLDGLLGRGGFTAKCKSLIKLTKNRIDVIRRKRKATEKFLKKDVADLLANGLDDNAYGRAEGLIVELTLSSCYDYVEQSCEFVLKHLSVLQKLTGCPEECREAISSLMFAAARFSDLPELRDLRQIFQERYGNSLECYVNQEFAANLNLKSSTTLEKKVRLMQDIASEFSIKWDSKAFELRTSKSSAFAQGHIKSYHPTDHNKPLHFKDFKPEGVKHDVLLEKTSYYPNDGHKFRNGKEAAASKGDKNDLYSKSKLPENGFRPPNSRDEVNLHRDNHANPLPGREELTSKKSDRGYLKPGSMLKPLGISSQDKRVDHFEGRSDLHDRWGNATPPLRESQDIATARKSPTHAGFHSKNNINDPFAVNHGSLPAADSNYERKDETPRLKPPPYYNNAIPPPYVKPYSKMKNSSRGTDLASIHIGSDGIPAYPSVHEKPDASTSEGMQLGYDSHGTRHARLGKESNGKELPINDDATEVPVLNPKSMRRRHSKSLSSNNDISNNDAEVARKSKSRSRSRRLDETRRGLQILFDDEHKNEEEERKEERIIDRLLIHYSKKPSISVPEKSRRRSKTRHEHSTRESLKNGNRDGPDQSPVTTHPHRSASFPTEQPASVEGNKVFARAASFQPDKSNEARHVHPNLPDYDDLAARIAALRGEFKG